MILCFREVTDPVIRVVKGAASGLGSGEYGLIFIRIAATKNIITLPH